MLRFAHSADWHIDRHETYSINGSRLKQLYRNALRIVKYAVKAKCEYIIVVGDIFDNENPDEQLLKVFAKIIKVGLKNGLKWRILIGNHDTDGEHHSLESLEDILDNIDGNKLKIISNDGGKVSDWEFWGDYAQVCYIPYQENMIEQISKVKKSNTWIPGRKRIIVVHGGVDMAYASTGKKLSSKLTLDMLKGYDYVALGDYHPYQKLGNENIYYPGSIIRLNFGERNDQKAFNIVSVSDEIKVKKVKLPDIEFIQVRIKYSQCKKFRGKIFEKFRGQNVDGGFVKLFIYGSIGTGEDIYYVKKAFYDSGAVQVYEKIISTKDNYDSGEESELELSIDLIESCDKYARSKTKDEQIINYGLEKIKDVV